MRKSIRHIAFLMILGGFLCASSCDEDPMDSMVGDLEDIPYSPTNYSLSIPLNFPEMDIPADNPLTFEGVFLGRQLFYDPILSIDSSLSCASCHLPGGAFTDNLPIAHGVAGVMGRRSSMGLVNIGFHTKGLFWDGRSPTLEDLSLLPIEDPLEMQEKWENVELKLRNHPDYPGEFRKAFGVSDRSEITRHLASKAISQFLRTIVSSGNSKFDRFIRGEVAFTEDEEEGYLMFFDLVPDLPDAECGHCHNDPLFTTLEYFNNGIQEAANFNDFADMGLGAITGDSIQNGLFKVPSLRNIEYSAPYMHDGRFGTLEEVVKNYNMGGRPSPNKHPLVSPLGLTPKQQEQVVAFLFTLSDTTTLQNPALSNPY